MNAKFAINTYFKESVNYTLEYDLGITCDSLLNMSLTVIDA
ncbi:MAG: hypothetical protein ACJATI_000064 [Halioglobus sp.]|jgi:hypothetical protein